MIATDFVRNSSTFKFDGLQESLRSGDTGPGPTSAFRSIAVTVDFQTRQPGHGDRTGKILPQVITDHSAVVLVNTETWAAAGAICDKTWDMVKDRPVTPLPVVSEEVSWAMGETVVAATVTRPDDHDLHPAVVFVAGSGPTDRDWNSPLLPGTNGSARLLAEELAKNGFVTIRYDKRVSGPNAQKNLPFLVGKISMESHVDELAGAVDLLLARPDVDRNKVLVVGNSEGTIHALNYQIARQHKFAGLILTGMPGRNLADLMRAQLAAQVATLPNAGEIMAGYDRLMADFMAGKPFVADPALPGAINQLVQGLSFPVNLPFTREFFALDPAPLLGKVTAPALVMIGKKDVQVDYLLDGAPLEAAAKGHDNISFAYPENANHVFKNEPRPRQALTGADALTYNAPDRVLDAEALRIVRDWLEKYK